MKSRKLRVLLVSGLSLTAGAARAEDWAGARSAARGGASLADADDVGAVGQNVAAVALGVRYDLVAGGVAGPDDTWLGRVAAADSRTSIVTLGATYTYRTDNLPAPSDALPGWSMVDNAFTNTTMHQGLSLGLAYPFLERKMSVALTGRYDWRDSEQEGKDDGFNFGASLAARPWEPVTLSIGVHNVLDLGYADTTRLVDFGVRWQPGTYLGVSGELTTEWMGNPFEESIGEHLGADLGVTQWLRLSAGWQHQNGNHRVGGGIALVSEKAELDYSITGEVGGSSARLWHGLDLRAHF